MFFVKRLLAAVIFPNLFSAALFCAGMIKGQFLTGTAPNFQSGLTAAQNPVALWAEPTRDGSLAIKVVATHECVPSYGVAAFLRDGSGELVYKDQPPVFGIGPSGGLLLNFGGLTKDQNTKTVVTLSHPSGKFPDGDYTLDVPGLVFETGDNRCSFSNGEHPAEPITHVEKVYFHMGHRSGIDIPVLSANGPTRVTLFEEFLSGNDFVSVQDFDPKGSTGMISFKAPVSLRSHVYAHMIDLGTGKSFVIPVPVPMPMFSR